MIGVQVPEYLVASVAAAVVVALMDRYRWHTGLVREPAWRWAMGICLFFMILVNGWLTKLSAPIVLYDADQKSPWRFPFDIPIEDYFFGFALLHWVLCRWVVLGRRQGAVTDARRVASTPGPPPSPSAKPAPGPAG